MLKKPKSKSAESNSFTTSKCTEEDGLIIARLQLVASLASIMKPYLQMFPGRCSTVALSHQSNKKMLETSMRKFVKGREIEAADTPFKIAKLNTLKTATHVATSEIDIGFGATSTLTYSIKEKKLSSLQVFEFRKECCMMLATIVSKIQVRSPLKYNFSRKFGSRNHGNPTRECCEHVSTGVCKSDRNEVENK